MAQGVKNWHNKLVGGCKGLPAEDHLGDFFSRRDITHKMVGNRTINLGLRYTIGDVRLMGILMLIGLVTLLTKRAHLDAALASDLPLYLG